MTDFDISPERGFLPTTDPLSHLSDQPLLNQIAQELPKLLTARQFRHFIQGRTDVLSAVPANWSLDQLRCAMRTLSFAGHAYVWEDPEHPAARLAASLARPWYEVARRLGRPPVLSYASYALHNWRKLKSRKPIELGNIVLLQNFFGGPGSKTEKP